MLILGSVVVERLEQAQDRVLHRLTNVDQTNPDGVEHQSVAEIATMKVSVDGLNRGRDVLGALSVWSAQRLTVSVRTFCRTLSLSESAGTRSTLASSSRSSWPRKPTSVNRPMPGRRSTSRSMSLFLVC